MGLISNRVSKDSLKPGDHIYTWRAAYIYAHHGGFLCVILSSDIMGVGDLLGHNLLTLRSKGYGIYVGDNKVIHFTRHGREVATGTVLDVLLVSSGPASSYVTCPTCVPPEGGHGVVSSCLDCFLAGGILYRFEYAVNPALFVAKVRGGTCTLAVCDPPEKVVHRAKFLLESGFGFYNVFKNNCEDFTIYCKTGLVVVERGTMGQSGQAASIVGGPLAAVLSTPLRLVTANVFGMATVGVGVYCLSRVAADIGMRRDVVRVEVEELTRQLALALLAGGQPLAPPPPPCVLPSGSAAVGP